MDSTKERERASLAELRGSDAWKWLQRELMDWLDAEYTAFENGFDNRGDYEFHRGRAEAIREIANITELSKVTED